MFFCKKCGYSNNYTKDTISKKSNETKKYEEVTNIFEKYMGNEELTEEDIENIMPIQLLQDERYDRMNKKDQRKFMMAVKNVDKKFFADDSENDENDSEQNVAYFICKYCNFTDPIKPGTVIFSKQYNLDSRISTEIEDYSHIIHSRILPRTKNYICKNIICDTHKNIDSREAVITKNNADRVIYVCTVCKLGMFI